MSRIEPRQYCLKCNRKMDNGECEHCIIDEYKEDKMKRFDAIKRIKKINLILASSTEEQPALVDERATLIAEHDLFDILLEHEGKRLEYGHCPQCDESCQPEYGDDDDEEIVVCCDCKIEWTLHHDDPTDKRDNTEPWRTYRISYVRSFVDDLIQPYACKDE